MRALLVVAALVTGTLLAACQPSYNWREIVDEEGAYRVLLPAKPVSMSRPIHLGDLEVTMSMTGARVDESLFTIGTVELPSDDDALRERATRAMRDGMVRNVQGHETTDTQVEVPVVDALGMVVGRAPGTRVEVDGRIGDDASHMSAIFVARGDRAWQVVMIAPEFDPEAAEVFRDSFRITR